MLSKYMYYDMRAYSTESVLDWVGKLKCRTKMPNNSQWSLISQKNSLSLNIYVNFLYYININNEYMPM